MHVLLDPLTPYLGIYLANIPAHKRNDGYTKLLIETLLIREMTANKPNDVPNRGWVK